MLNKHNNSLTGFSGQFSAKLAKEVARELGQKLGKIEFRKFSDGEIWLKYKEDIRGKDVFIIQSFPPPAENLLELLLMLDAAKRALAKKVVAIIPYFGYGRQDKKEQPGEPASQRGEPISAELMVKLLFSAGADRILTIDFHSDKMNAAIRNVFTESIFLPNAKKYLGESLRDLAILTPDLGRIGAAKRYARQLRNCPVVVINKERTKPNQVRVGGISGEVKDKTVLIVDDIVDTGNTLVAAANTAKKMGAKKIFAFVTHALFSGEAVEKINESPISRLFISDTIPFSSEKRSNKIKLVSVAPLLAQAIREIGKN